MSRSFLDQIKYIVENPSEWPTGRGSLNVCASRFNEVKDNFPPPPEPAHYPSFMGVEICVDESVPENEIRFVSIVRDPATNEYLPRVDRIINIGPVNTTAGPEPDRE